MDNTNLKIDMARMQENITHTKEKVDDISKQMNEFIEKVEANYATKKELQDHKCRIEDNETSIESLRKLQRSFLVWVAITLISILGFLFATAKDVIINNFI